MSQSPRDNQLPPGEWVGNDFAIGDRITVDSLGACTVKTNNKEFHNLTLTVIWDKVGFVDQDERVWPNLQWVGYLPEDSV